MSPKVKLPLTSDWSLSVAKIQSDLKGELKFGANPNTIMGEQCRRDDVRNSKSDYRGNPGSSHWPHGLVQHQTPTSMEASISANAKESSHGVSSSDRLGMGTDGKAVVEAPRQLTLDCSQEIDGGFWSIV